MSSCRVTRARLLKLVRGTASDAARLQVESHLEECEACRIERARLGLLGWLKVQPAPTLSASANRRVLARLLEVPRGRPSRCRSAESRYRPWLFAAFAFMLSAAALVLSLRGRGSVELTESRQIEATTRGVVVFGGAHVAYAPGTRMLAEPSHRQLGLSRGEVDVDVDPRAGLPGHFRVVTDSFVVEVVGTHFVVTPRGVRTLRGRVRVLDLADREVAVLEAGESWTVPPAVVHSAEVSLTPATATMPIALPLRERAAQAPALPARAHAGTNTRRTGVAELLARSRSAMSDGDADQARSWIARARAAGPTDEEAATLDLLDADVWLVAKQPDAGIAAYRHVANRWSGTTQAETATFAVGQLLVESGSPSAAETALSEYLAHYPHGRFVREAREQLEIVRAPK